MIPVKLDPSPLNVPVKVAFEDDIEDAETEE